VTRFLDASAVSTRLADVATLIDGVDEVVELDESTWGWAFEGLDGCLLEMEAGGALLAASIDIGTPADTRRAQVDAAALTYNSLWRQTRGKLIVQDGEDGALTLVQQIAADDVYSDGFGSILEELGAVAAWWQAYVAHDGPDGDPSGIAPTGMRV